MIVLSLLGGLIVFTLLISPLFARRLRESPRILALHSLEPHFFDLSSISLGEFGSLIEMCDQQGLRIGTIAESITDSNTVAITFDDGYSDLLALLPLLEKRRLPITVFMPTAYIGKANSWDNFLNRGKRRHLSAVEIKQLADAGVEFGSHSHTHCDLSLFGADDIETELRQSKQILEALIGREVRYVAYPFGRSNDRVTAIARKLGYQNGLWSAPHRANEFNLGRTPLNRLDSILTIRAKLRPHILSGAEYLKSLIINCFSHLTPLVARFSSRSHSR